MVEKGGNKKTLLHISGNTTDIITAIVFADKNCSSYTTNLSKTLRRRTIQDTCQAIYTWVKNNIEYKEDPEGYQFIQSPGHLFWGKNNDKQGKGDCKSMSVFCASVLQNLGLQYAYRFISQERGSDYHHVFVVVKDENGKTIVLDCVDKKFNQHQNFAKVKDVPGCNLQPATQKAAIGYKRPSIGATNSDPSLYFDSEYIKTLLSPTKLAEAMKTVVKTPPNLWNITVTRKDTLGNDVSIQCFGKTFNSWKDYVRGYEEAIVPFYINQVFVIFQKIDTDWNSMKWLAVFEPISVLLLSEKGKDKSRGYFIEVFEKAMLQQLLYSYWDDSVAKFPNNLKEKREQAIDFRNGLINSKVNDRRTGLIVDKNKEKYWNEFNIRIFADYHCFLTYGYPLDVLLQKAYNKVNIGTESVLPPGAPYYNLTQDQWIKNGATDLQMGWITGFCVPASPKGKWITYYNETKPTWVPNYNPTASSHYVPYTIPYWCKGGFVMSNGATQEAVDLFKKENPAPPGLVTTNLTNVINGYTAFYKALVLDPMFSLNNSSIFNRPGGFKGMGSAENAPNYAGIKPFDTKVGPISSKDTIRPTVTATSNFTVRGYGSPKIGLAPIVIAAIISAVVALISGILGIIMQALAKSKSKDAIERDITDFPTDFKNGYQTTDGCFMEPVNMGGIISYNKRCPDGTITPNANPNDPVNAPAYAPGGLFSGTNSRLLLVLGLAAAGLYLLLFNKKSK